MLKNIIITATFTIAIAAAAAHISVAAEDSRVVSSAGAAQYPPFADNSNGRFNLSVPIVDYLPPTVPYPAQWPYVTSTHFAPGWAYPTWSPYTSRWYYYDRYPYYEWWSASDWLAFKDKMPVGNALKYSNRWEYPANWPYPNRWSPIDQWPKTNENVSTADTGIIDMVNSRNQAIGFGDYTFLLDTGDQVYITRNNRLLGIARVVAITNSYVMVEAVRVSHDYFIQTGDTFQIVSLAPALDDDHAPRVDSVMDDGRILSNFDFLSRKYKSNDFFTVRRNGINSGTARVVQLGYGYAILQPSEDTVPQPGDTLIFNQAPAVAQSIMHPRTISAAGKAGIFVDSTNEDRALQVEANNAKEQQRSLIKKMDKKKEWPDNDIWWEDTYNDQEPWPDQ